jgi:hypothetical protein
MRFVLTPISWANAEEQIDGTKKERDNYRHHPNGRQARAAHSQKSNHDRLPV